MLLLLFLPPFDFLGTRWMLLGVLYSCDHIILDLNSYSKLPTRINSKSGGHWPINALVFLHHKQPWENYDLKLERFSLWTQLDWSTHKLQTNSERSINKTFLNVKPKLSEELLTL